MEELSDKYLEEVKRLCQSEAGLKELARDLRKGREFPIRLQAAYDRHAPKHPDRSGPVEGIDKSGKTLALSGRWGGDLLDAISFGTDYGLEEIAQSVQDIEIRKRILEHRNRFGLFLVDAKGHDVIEAGYPAQLVHQNFRAKVKSYLRLEGHVAAGLFEELNNESPLTIATFAYLEVTLIRGGLYGRFISGGHPMPLLCRAKTHTLDEALMATWQPSEMLGAFVSPYTCEGNWPLRQGGVAKDPYVINSFSMEKGDILVCPSDGMTELGNNLEGVRPYIEILPEIISEISREHPDASAKKVKRLLAERTLTYSLPADDISFAVIKKT